DPGALRGRGGEVQRRGRARPVQEARLLVLVRGEAEPGPGRVVHLVVREPGERLPIWDLHAEQEFHLPARLVEQIRHAVLVLRDVQLAVAERGDGAERARSLVEVEQGPNGDAPVDDVLSVIAGVVPAAAHVEAVAAAARGLTRNALVALVSG